MNTKPTTPRARAIEAAHLVHALAAIWERDDPAAQWARFNRSLKHRIGKARFAALAAEEKENIFWLEQEMLRGLDAYQELELKNRALLFRGVVLENGKQVGYDTARFIDCPFKGRAILLVWQSAPGKAYDRSTPYTSKKRKRK